MSEVLLLQGVTHFYNGLCSLEEVSLKVQRGEFVGLVGSNGSGKTTLIKIILGLLKPTAGMVRLLSQPPERSRGKYVGYLPQDAVHFNPLFPATVEEVIRSGLVQKKSVDEKAVAQVMEELHLLPLRQRPIGHLSGGQKQRVLIARTLVRDPQLLILDEPATGVDFGAQEELMALLARLNQKRGITILMSGHDLNQLLRYAKRVVCLNRRVLYDGATAELSTEDLVATLFSGLGKPTAKDGNL